MSYRILVASQGSEIYTLSFDSVSKILSLVGSVDTGPEPSWIEFHRQDRSLVIACLSIEDGKVAIIKYNASGEGAVVAQASSGGAFPCSVLASNTELFAANYVSGSISVLPITSTLPYFSSQSPIIVQLEGSGPNLDRQEASHAHQVFLLEEYDELLVPDLGGDRVYRFKKLTPTSPWSIYSYIQFPAGSGPRHVAYHSGVLYTVLELNSTIAAHPYSSSAEPAVVPVSSLKPTKFHPPPTPNDMLASEILIPRPNGTYPIPYVYASNRNDPASEGDSIAIFSAYPDVKLVAEVHTGLRHLRGMAFGGPDDKWLIAGGANGGGVKIYERVDDGKGMKETTSLDINAKPSGFLWAK